MKPTSSDFMESAGGSPRSIFAENECSMIEIKDDDYGAIASSVISAIGSREFFNGSVTYDCEEYSARLTATLIIYRDCRDHGVIGSIVPVWWEFSTMSPDGLFVPNDFSFRLMIAEATR